MSRRFKILLYKTLLTVPTAHTFDVLNFNSGKCNTFKDYGVLLHKLFTDKTKPSLIIPGLNVGYFHSISSHILLNLISPLIKHKYIRKSRKYNSSKCISQIKASFYTGAILRTLTEPIRYIKIGYMASKGAIPLYSNVTSFHNVQDLIDKTYINYGIKYFYKGLLPSILSGGIGNAIDTALFTSMKRLFKHNNKLPLWQRFVFSTISSTISRTIVFPLEKANIEMIADQIRQKQIYTGYKDIFSKMYSTSGMKGCFSGVGLVLVSGVVTNIIEYSLKNKYNKKRRKKKAIVIPQTNNINVIDKPQ